MSKVKKDTIEAKGFAIQIYTEDFKNDYISLTDIAKYKNTDDPRFVIQNGMRNRNTLEFIGLWEVLNNENFNRVQFDTFRNEAGLNRFTMTPQKWIDSTNAIGIISKGSNSTPLERKQEQMHLHCRLRDGSKIQMQSVLFLNPGEVGERSLILI